METVRTSEVLESQILEDARGKAKRLLDSADKECAAIRAEAERLAEDESDRAEAMQVLRDMETLRAW